MYVLLYSTLCTADLRAEPDMQPPPHTTTNKELPSYLGTYTHTAMHVTLPNLTTNEGHQGEWANAMQGKLLFIIAKYQAPRARVQCAVCS